MTTPKTDVSDDIVARDNDEMSLVDLAIVFAKHKKMIIGLPLVAGIVAAIASLYMPPIYTATTRILPPQQNQSTAAAMLGQLGAFAGLAGGALGIKSPAEMYVGLLKSRTVADDLIKRFDLEKLYEAKYMADARNALKSASRITLDKDGLITIEAESPDPKLSAALANGYIEELSKLSDNLAVTEAGQRRLFFERQLHDAKNNLTKVEERARSALQDGGIAMVDEQGKALVETTAALRAQIAAKEVQIGAMRSFATDGNPELVRAKEELVALTRQMEKIEGAGIGERRVRAPATGVAGLHSLSLLRDVKYYQVLVDLLSRQYEAAKIDEAKEGAIIQVVDKAILPERRSKPKRTLIIVLSTLIAGFIAMLLAFVKEALENAKENPESREQMNRLRRYLAWR